MEYTTWVETVLHATAEELRAGTASAVPIAQIATRLTLPSGREADDAGAALRDALDDLEILRLVQMQTEDEIGLTNEGLLSAESSIREAASWITFVRDELNRNERGFLEALHTLSAREPQPERYARRRLVYGTDVFEEMGWGLDPDRDASHIIRRLSERSCIGSSPAGDDTDVWLLYAGYIAAQPSA